MAGLHTLTRKHPYNLVASCLFFLKQGCPFFFFDCARSQLQRVRCSSPDQAPALGSLNPWTTREVEVTF